ncbi:MAG: CusA/CzcA family heavy metal efflux RND transporter [Tannerella sp.]|jgi:cobalt-zinc-cadmium resistance protein CzcA|nr:CusA/CzcA family heavy metal efflux RND transporter [Tannerella sp.]
MNKFIKNILTFSLKNKFFTFFWVFILFIAGIISFLRTPIDAFPDITNTQIIIITQWNGRSAEEVERFITTPIEIAMNSVQKKTSVRSTTMFGLSVIKIIFDDEVDDSFARQQVNNQLGTIDLPEGISPEVQPPYGPTGEIFRYVLKSKTENTRDLLTLQNWVIDRELRSVPGVADVNVFGGQDKIYELHVDPFKLDKYDLTPLEVYDAVNGSNLNVGGDIIEKNDQAFVVRGLGLLDNIDDIKNIIIKNESDNPILVKDVAAVVETGMPRVGQTGYQTKTGEDKDVLLGIVVMRKGENTAEVLKSVKQKVEEIKKNTIPKEVEMITVYDRDNLMDYCLHTVSRNLLEGIILVTVIVFLFMGDWRTTFTVALVIPLALLFAFICLRIKGMNANLISLGAVDFGIIIDGAIVMVEGIFVTLDQLAKKKGIEKFNKLSKLGLIRSTGTELGKAIFFSKLIIITALMPIFSFQKVEGKMFSPLAWTLGFALLGALIFTLTLVPVLSSILLRKNVVEKHTLTVRLVNKYVFSAFKWCYHFQKKTIIVTLLILGLTLISSRWLGTEFLPQLNEGALWVTAELPMSASLTESMKITEDLRSKLTEFPEVTQVISQTGRSNDGTDPNGFNFVQFQVDLKPKAEWSRDISQEELVGEMDKELKRSYQGITYNYAQPISDNVAEAAAGFKAANAVKILGRDQYVLDSLARLCYNEIKNIRGIEDAGVLKNIGQPEVSIKLDEQKMALYGVTKKDAQAVIEMAIGGKTATEKFEGDKKFDVRIRYAKEYRKNEEDFKRLRVPTISGSLIPLSEIADFNTHTGPAFVYRDDLKRFIGVKFSVRDRDLGSTIAEAQAKIDKAVKLPKGYTFGWTGEFENQVRATHRLAQVVPISLLIIYFLLFVMFGNTKEAGLVLLNVPFALIGGIWALFLTGTNFGISAGVGMIALFGICVQNGVILVSVFNKLLREGYHLVEAIKEGVRSRIRPVMMTALMASIGLLPAAVSHGIGSENQRPFAIVIIGGLFTATLFTLLVFPIFCHLFYSGRLRKLQKRKDKKTEEKIFD